MPSYEPYTTQQLKEMLERIERAIYTPLATLEINAWRTAEPTPYAQRQQGETLPNLKTGDRWGKLFDCAWFHFTGSVPASGAGKHIVMLLDINGELCVVDEQGAPRRGLTNVSSGYDYRLGKPGKRVLEFLPRANGGETVDFWADAGCNDLFGELREDGAVKEALIAACDDATLGLYYDFEVLLDYLGVLDPATPRYKQILHALNQVCALLAHEVAYNAPAARQILARPLGLRGGDAALTISAVGHAHMDLAWLWPLRETIRKGARTFSTALDLIERYPGYVFGASQPQYFQWMKDHYPSLYARIKQAVANGSIEPQGVMWVEADTNISGGEALVRQALYGQAFWKAEFDREVDYLWLPDVFGYSGALPQILKKAGVDIFSTQKLSWSLINTFPHQSFKWQGIDGSIVLAHMYPEETYNSPAAPRSVRMIENNYRDAGVSDRAIMVFGIGDGGGGPGEEHLERLARIQNLAGLSPVKMESAADFFKVWKKDADSFATWKGELYLERHEGTLTSNARNKYYNRRMELALRELEWMAVLAGSLTGAAYPKETIDRLWKETLLYQFHDILPGSSIKRVYDESVARYQTMLAETTQLTENLARQVSAALDTSAFTAPVVVFNPLSWERVEWIEGPQGWVEVTVPALGYTVIEAAHTCAPAGLKATPTTLENDLLRVTFAEDGSITSVFDKAAQREAITPGCAANRLAVYTDLGDAWDFPMDYANQTPRIMALESATARVEGPQAIVEQRYRLGASSVTQRVILTAGSGRLDFRTQVHWRERRSMLRVSFPVNVWTDEATYEIQFGALKRPTHRNTTWDLARDETVGHKFADLSQRDYGVALLNDSKYGYKIKEGVIDLNLLRSAPYPNSHDADVTLPAEEAHYAYSDQCDHQFTYALLPHSGDHVAGSVARRAYELNVPLRRVEIAPKAGALPASASFIQVDQPGVVVEAVKQAEDGSGVVIRLYEKDGAGCQTDLRISPAFAAAYETNLLEKLQSPLEIHHQRIHLTFSPFEIKTVKLQARA